MGSETTSATNSPSQSPSRSGKRSRDPEDEVYLDNLHSQKRYLSEIMASSLNGLTVGDPIPDNMLSSPARSDSMFYLRDEIPQQYSPMSEDFDDTRYCETSMVTCSSQPESRPTSPVSPYRYKPLNAFCSSPPSSTSSQHSSACTVLPASYPQGPQPRQRSSDTEGRFPSSPSDICHSADLRRAALLRSVQMRAHPPGPSTFELHFAAGQDPIQNVVHNGVGQPCSYMKSLGDEQEYQLDNDGCSSMGVSEPEFDRETSCADTKLDKGEESRKSMLP